MRGRQQVYPTFECAPNRALRTLKIPRDMPIFRGSERAFRAYVQWRRGTRGMPCGAGSGGVRGWTCPFFAAPSAHAGPLSSGGAGRGACPVGRGPRGQLGDAGKFRYSSICF